MKILNRKDFLKLPAGVLFAGGTPWLFGSLSVKGDTISADGKDIDFWSKDAVFIQFDDSDEFPDIFEGMLERRISCPMNSDYERDGTFDDSDVFLVYEKPDLERLRDFIGQAIKLDDEELKND